jgi:hypothetical protein
LWAADQRLKIAMAPSLAAAQLGDLVLRREMQEMQSFQALAPRRKGCDSQVRMLPAICRMVGQHVLAQRRSGKTFGPEVSRTCVVDLKINSNRDNFVGTAQDWWTDQTQAFAAAMKGG